MIPIQFKDTVARKYGYKHFQELLGVYFKCTKTRIQAMKTTKVYVNDSLVVLYGEWPVEPHYQKHVTKEHAEIMVEYEQALKKAIAEAVPFEEQIRVSKLLLTQAGISSGESQEEVGPRFARAFKPGFYDIQAEVEVKEIHDFEKDCDTDSFFNTKKVAVIKPLSSGEKEPLTLDKCFAIEQAASKALSEIHKITTLCADEHEENIFRQGFHCGVLSKPSPVDTNIEEKKAEEIVGDNIPSFKEAAERYANLIHHVDPLHHEACALDFEAGAKYGYATTRPVQEKPDFEKMTEDLVANDMLKLANNIWKNYVELETSRAEGWRKQYYDWKDLLLTTEEENRKLKQEIERLKGIIRYAHDIAYILVNTPKAVKEYCQKDARRLFDKLSEGIESGKTT